MATFDFSILLLDKYSKPSITSWNRLDSFPRTTDMGRGLRCEVRDAMWMLTRQWQFGEFTGEDAGSPVSAKVSGLHRTPDSILVKDQSIPYDSSIPLEAIVEREEVVPTLRLRVQMGRMFFKLLRANKAPAAYPFFIAHFPLPDFSADKDASTRQFYISTAGGVADGYEIYKKCKINTATFFNGLSDNNLTPEVIKIINESVFPQFIKWFDQLYFQVPNTQSAWLQSRMEYGFSLSVPHVTNRKTLLSSPDYPGGRLDWTAFDLHQDLPPVSIANLPEPVSGEQKSDVFLPSIVTFKGMPHPRFWQMEAGNMDFGKIEKSPAGIVGLLLAEYGLTYSNDWFLLPYPIKTNTLCSIQGILVTDVFGQRSFVSPSRMTSNTSWQEFALFDLTQNNRKLSRQQVFYLPPVLGAVQESEPLERVYFMRDEMANLMWAIEDIVPAQTGGGKKIIQYQPQKPPPNPDPETWRYTLGTTVPEHWIPFVAVHKTGSENEIQLQRARMPNAAPPGSLLLSEVQPVHFIESQEVPRAGVIVERSMQRVRWLDGRTYLWAGRRKMTGRGEGSSELVFDKVD